MTDNRKASDDEIMQAMMGGIKLSGTKLNAPAKTQKVKTIAKKKAYITGSHGSASAMKKAKIRQQRANRHKGKA